MERKTGPQKPHTLRKQHRDAAGKFAAAPKGEDVLACVPEASPVWTGKFPCRDIPVTADGRRRMEEEAARRRAQREGLPYKPRLPVQTGEDRTHEVNVDSSPAGVRWTGIVESETQPVRGYTPGEMAAVGFAVLVAAFLAALMVDARWLAWGGK